MKKSPDELWCEKHFSPKETFVIGHYWFGIIDQPNDTMSIKVINLHECERSPDEGQWVAMGGGFRFETNGGCYGAILYFLQRATDLAKKP